MYTTLRPICSTDTVSAAPASTLGTMGQVEDNYNEDKENSVHIVMDENESTEGSGNDVFLDLSQMTMGLEDDSDTNMDEDDAAAQLDDDMIISLRQISSRLCPICRQFPPRGRIYLDDEGDFQSISYHPSLSSLRESVNTGCRLCSDLMKALESFCRPSDPQETLKEFWSIRCRIVPLEGFFGFRFEVCQSEHAHPIAGNCEDTRNLLRMNFYPAGKLSLGPEFLSM